MQIVKNKTSLINHRKHIALLLLGIFFFPILFQSVHIVWHHASNHKREHHLCEQKSFDKDAFSKEACLHGKEERCLICDYKFSINDSPKRSFFNLIVPAIAFVFNEADRQQQYKQFFSDKTPRAPPVLIS